MGKRTGLSRKGLFLRNLAWGTGFISLRQERLQGPLREGLRTGSLEAMSDLAKSTVSLTRRFLP